MGESIAEITAESACSMGCFCAEGYPKGTPPRITCAQVDCQPYPSGGGCVPIRKSDSDCCSEYYCPGSKKFLQIFQYCANAILNMAFYTDN